MILDLSMPISERTPVYPGDPRQEIEQIETIHDDGWNKRRICFSSHFSTHIDAPSHRIEGGKTLSEYPLEHLTGDGIVLDVRGMQTIRHSLEDVQAGDIVFFFTGHTDKAYEDSFFVDNPVLSQELARQLVAKEVKIVGIDSFSPDNEPHEIHDILLRNDILIVENLVNLENIAGKRFLCYIMPLNIENADGSPCRVAAVI